MTSKEAEPAFDALSEPAGQRIERHFDALLWQGLGLDRHPELLPLYFANYRRVVLLSQSTDPAVVDAATQAASRLGLPLEHHHVGRGHLADAVTVTLGRVG